MEVLLSVGTVIFVILAVLLVIIILLQSDKSAGMGILGGSSQSAFGSSTADIITKITTVMVAIFMLGSLGLSILSSYGRSSISKDIISGEAKPAAVQESKADEKAVKKAVKEVQPKENKETQKK